MRARRPGAAPTAVPSSAAVSLSTPVAAAGGRRRGRSSTGSIVTIPAKSQNGSMIRTMMNVLEPMAWTRSPTMPATNPTVSPRSSGSSS